MTCCTSNTQGKVIFLSAKTLCLNLCVSLCLLFSALAFLMGVPDWLMFSFESLIGWCCVQHYCYRWSQQFQVLAFFSKFPLINQDPRDYDQTINTFTLIQFLSHSFCAVPKILNHTSTCHKPSACELEWFWMFPIFLAMEAISWILIDVAFITS